MNYITWLNHFYYIINKGNSLLASTFSTACEHSRNTVSKLHCRKTHCWKLYFHHLFLPEVWITAHHFIPPCLIMYSTGTVTLGVTESSVSLFGPSESEYSHRWYQSLLEIIWYVERVGNFPIQMITALHHKAISYNMSECMERIINMQVDQHRRNWTSNPLANKTAFWTSRSSFITSLDDFHSFICSIIYRPLVPSHAVGSVAGFYRDPSQWMGLRWQRPQTGENPHTGFVTKPDNTLARIKRIYSVPIQFFPQVRPPRSCAASGLHWDHEDNTSSSSELLIWSME